MIPPPGAHGGDGPRVAAALGLDDVLDLSLTLNPVAPDPAPVIAAHLRALARYPDAAPATAALAERMGVDPDRLLLTNGGAEAIALVLDDLREGDVVDPEFSLYRRHLRRVTPGAPRVRSNPHSPSGLLAGPGETAAVWDEAFYPLATGRWTRGDGVVVGSLTKLLACPGLRVGYVLAGPDVVRRLRDRQPAWSVNGLAAAALPDLVAAVDLPAWACAVGRLRAALVDVLVAAGLRPRPSDAPWVLVDAPGLRARLAPAGVVVRDCASFGLPGVSRVAVPDDGGRERLRAALESTGA